MRDVSSGGDWPHGPTPGVGVDVVHQQLRAAAFRQRQCARPSAAVLGLLFLPTAPRVLLGGGLVGGVSSFSGLLVVLIGLVIDFGQLVMVAGCSPLKLMPVETCAICQLHGDPAARGRYEIERSELWVLRHHPDPAPLPGWLLLDSLRHCSGPVDFSEAEASGWGGAVRDASDLVKQITGCDRVAIAFGEVPNISICVSFPATLTISVQGLGSCRSLSVHGLRRSCCCRSIRRGVFG